MSNQDEHGTLSSTAHDHSTGSESAATETSDGLWTIKEVAAFLKVSNSWAYKKAASAELPCIKMDGVLRFDPAVIRAFVRGEVKPKGARIVILQPLASRG